MKRWVLALKTLPFEWFIRPEVGSTCGGDEFFVRVALDFLFKVHEEYFSYLTLN